MMEPLQHDDDDDDDDDRAAYLNQLLQPLDASGPAPVQFSEETASYSKELPYHPHTPTEPPPADDVTVTPSPQTGHGSLSFLHVMHAHARALMYVYHYTGAVPVDGKHGQGKKPKAVATVDKPMRMASEVCDG